MNDIDMNDKYGRPIFPCNHRSMQQIKADYNKMLNKGTLPLNRR